MSLAVGFTKEPTQRNTCNTTVSLNIRKLKESRKKIRNSDKNQAHYRMAQPIKTRLPTEPTNCTSEATNNNSPQSAITTTSNNNSTSTLQQPTAATATTAATTTTTTTTSTAAAATTTTATTDHQHELSHITTKSNKKQKADRSSTSAETHYITHSATRRSTATTKSHHSSQLYSKLQLTKPTTATTTTNLFTFSRPDFFKRITTTITTSIPTSSTTTPTSSPVTAVNNHQHGQQQQQQQHGQQQQQQQHGQQHPSPTTTTTTNRPDEEPSSPRAASIISNNSSSTTNQHHHPPPPPHTTIKNHKKESSISSITGIGLSSIGFLVNSAANLAHSSHHNNNNTSNNNNNNSSNTMNFSTISSTTKPVIRHITSSSTLASINNNQTLLSLSKPDPSSYPNNLLNSSSSHHNPNPPTESNHNLSGLILKPGDVWSQVILRVIPLFNGEGHKGFIEDLNDFVSQHIHKTIADSPSKSIIKLHSDITELLANGVMILNNKLQPDQLTDERLLVRVFEVWHFFFTGVLPYLEAIFLPLMSDENLLNMIESKNNKVLQERLQQQHLLHQATTNASLFSSSSSSILFRQSNRNNPITQQPKNRSTGSPNARADQEVIQGIDIRKLALIAFREHLIVPIYARLYKLFVMLYDPNALPQSSNSPGSIDSQSSEHMHLKRLQMVGLLCSVQTDDSRQSMMAEFSKLIRLKKANPDLLVKLPSSTTIRNIPPRTASANPNAASPGSNNGTRDVAGTKNPYTRDRSESSSSSHSRASPPQQQTPRQSTSNSTTTTTTNSNLNLHPEEYDDDRPLVNLLDDEIESQHIKGWNKNRDFARRSIRRQLGRNGTAIRRMSRANDENFSQQPLATNSMRRPERVQRNRGNHPSAPRNIEDGTPDSSPAHPNGSPLGGPTSATMTTATFSSQGAGRASFEDEEQSLEYLSDRVYSYYPQTDAKESSQRSRVHGGTTKTGSASSNGSVLSILLPPTSSSTSASASSHHNPRVHNLTGAISTTAKSDELDSPSMSTYPSSHDTTTHPTTSSKLATSINRLNNPTHPSSSQSSQYLPTQPLRPHHHQHLQHHHHHHHHPHQQPHLNLSIEPLKLSHYRSRSSSNLSKESSTILPANHHQPHQLSHPTLSSSSSSSTGPPTPQF
ncbi:hypothetical protein PGT21_033486 [Puccinia graminis f. sp. tritici]|uniref:Target of rapamycin complex 2 subunit bit61 n=1 Tax=Puccinia graminis f. sp. tritici TaxID=56615 RepID=A0A5B0R4D5_PUCGR|nr:hypothetical protein PGT21_033486 [Puccinia graminis f. sp. tritici]KAA1120367.1 hypothetical protein PGTUg99_019870 [Puccinia graminis f. sp. tritici]